MKAGLRLNHKLVQNSIIAGLIFGTQGEAFAGTEMYQCSPPTKGVVKVDKNFTMPIDMSWGIDETQSIINDMSTVEVPDMVPAGRQGGLPGKSNIILETYQFYFPIEGTDLSDEDKSVLETALNNPSYTINYVLIRSYTDKTGTTEGNEEIAIGRAEAVRGVAVERGVVPEVICAEILADGWNEEEENARGNEPESDRRVEVYVYLNRWRI